MVRWSLAIVFVVVATACAPDEASRSTARPSPSASAATVSPRPAVSSEPSERLPDPITVKGLPESGIVVDNGRDVLLLSDEGKVVRRFRNFIVAGNPGSSVVWLQKGRDHFRIAVRGDMLLPVASKEARSVMHEEGVAPDLPPPPGSKIHGKVAGRWRYAYTSPQGDTLVQWSGECEVPAAYWRTGTELELVTGGIELEGAPESIALGWSRAGDAIVLLGEGHCGTAGDPPGIYAFSAPGEGRLIFKTKPGARGDMW